MIGDNGCGKSTLMRLIQGREKPKSGLAQIGDSDMCKVNYFYQNQAEGLDTNKSVLQTLIEAAPDAQLNDLKALLGQMAFSTPFHDKPVKFLSGGEKARLALAKFMVTPANVLLLDEPTNHLDIPSKEMLENAIRRFEGTVIAISHDRYFLAPNCHTRFGVRRGRHHRLRRRLRLLLGEERRRRRARCRARVQEEAG